MCVVAQIILHPKVPPALIHNLFAHNKFKYKCTPEKNNDKNKWERIIKLFTSHCSATTDKTAKIRKGIQLTNNYTKLTT